MPVGYLLTVRNERQKVLFEDELCGQISDGMWENARPWEHYKIWGQCDVVVALDPQNVGRNFHPRKDNYNFTAPMLLECVGERMIESVRTKCGLPNYGMKELKVDLKDLKKIVRTYCDNFATPVQS